MKVVILAGGFGTRISEETINIPKPMIEIGGRPMLWHIMKIYSYYGFKDFIIALGYKSDYIKKFFLETINFSGDIKIEFKKGIKKVDWCETDDITLELVDTGINTNTGGRLKFLENYLNETFLFTYGDGLANINITDLLNFHQKNKKLATITAVHPISRFGEISLSSNNTVLKFNEKPQVKNDWINGGFFIFNKNIFKYLRKDEEILEKYPLQKLANIRELKAYKHKNFWHCIDTIRDIEIVSNLIKIGKN